MVRLVMFPISYFGGTLEVHAGSTLLSVIFLHGGLHIHALVPDGEESAPRARYRIITLVDREDAPFVAPEQTWGFLGTVVSNDTVILRHVFWVREA